MTSRAAKLVNMALKRPPQPARGPLAALAQRRIRNNSVLGRPPGAQQQQVGVEASSDGPAQLSHKVVKAPINGPAQLNQQIMDVPSNSNRVESWVRDQQAQQTAASRSDSISVHSSKAPSIDVPDWFLDDEGPLPEYGLIQPQSATSPAVSGSWNVTDLQVTTLRSGGAVSCSPSASQWDIGNNVPSLESRAPVRRALFTDLELNDNRNLDDSTETLVSPSLETTPIRLLAQTEEIISNDDLVLPEEITSNEVINPIVEITPTNTSKKRRTSARKNSRKRLATPTEWAAERAKKAFNAGDAYVTPKGRIKNARAMRPGCHARCRKCKQRIPEKERERTFELLWNLPSIHRKRDFITRSVVSKKPASLSTIPSRARKSSRCYSLIVRSGSKEEKIIVCKKMFLDTLGIQDCWVETALKKCQGGNGQSPDKRGKHLNRPSRVSEITNASVRQHIDMFSRVPSHYTREKSKREYLEPHVKSVERMHKLYLKWAKSEHIEKVASIHTYRKIFNQEYNIGFFMPRKDQCETCNKWKNGKDQTERRGMMQEYALHLQNKKLVYKLKKEDKASASALKCVACFDLQKVLTCPRSQTSLFFYRNKLSLYNFTVFDLRLKEGHCYLWTEVDGLKGSNEIGSNLYHFINTKVEEGVREFVFWSDSPTGQNRNRMVFCMFLVAAAKLQIKITHRFLESGHSYTEADSMHARIENEAERKEIFTPDEWMKLIEEAKQDGKKYIMNKLENENISDLHYLVDRQNWDKNTNQEQVLWSKVREVVTDCKSPNTVFYRYGFSEQLKSVRVTMQDGSVMDLSTYRPPRAYQSKFSLKANKKKDIKFLCEKKAIPSKYHEVFDQYLSI